MIKRSSFVILMAAVFAAGCTDDSNIPAPLPPADDSTPPPAATTTVQIIHASADAPTVNATVGGNGGGLSSIDFKDSRFARSYAPGEAAVAFTINQPTGDPVAGPSTSVAGEADTFYAVFVLGDAAEGGEPITTQTFARSGNIPGGVTRPTLLHAAPGVGAVNVHVTDFDPAEGAGCDDPSALNQANTDPLAYGDSETVAADAPEGVYCVQVVPDGGTEAVFNTGPITLDGGTDPILAAVLNTNDGSLSPISVLSVGRLQHVDVQDGDTVAPVRVVHTISDLTTPVDIYIDGEITGITGLTFGDVAPVQAPGGTGAPIEPGEYVIQAFTGMTCAINCTVENPDGTVDEPEETELDAGVFYDAIAQGVVTVEEGALGPDPEPAIAYETGDRRRVSGFAKIRLIHSAGNVGDVDIYIEADPTNLPEGDADFEEVSFGGSTGFVGLAPGDYTVIVTATGSTDPVRTVPVSLADEGVYTAIVIDGTAQTDVIALDDFTTITP